MAGIKQKKTPKKTKPQTTGAKNLGGRPVAFSDPEVFEAKIQHYWKTISVDRAIMQPRYVAENVPGTSLKDMAPEDKAYMEEMVPVLSNAGEPVIETRWLKPPLLNGLYLHLGISKETWSDYGRKEGFSDSVLRARLVSETYLANETAARDGNTNGPKFLLSACYGYREVQGIKVEMSEKLEDDFA